MYIVAQYWPAHQLSAVCAEATLLLIGQLHSLLYFSGELSACSDYADAYDISTLFSWCDPLLPSGALIFARSVFLLDIWLYADHILFAWCTGFPEKGETGAVEHCEEGCRRNERPTKTGWTLSTYAHRFYHGILSTLYCQISVNNCSILNGCTIRYHYLMCIMTE